MYSIEKVLIFSALLTAMVNPVWGQDDPKQQARDYVTTAELMITETKAIDDARQLMVMAADLDTTNLKANYDAAMLHLITIGKDMAVKYLLRVYRQDRDYRFDVEYKIGQSYQYGLQFDKAIDFFNRYKEKMAKRPTYQGKDKVDADVVERHIFECMNGKDYVANPGNFSIVNMGRELNSEFDDYGPVLNENEDEVIFTSRRRDGNLNENVEDDNKPFEDIFYSRKSGGAWASAQNIGAPVGSTYHESTVALSADGTTLYVYSDQGGGDIFSSVRKGNGPWSALMPLPGIINSSYAEKSISVSRDQKTLYFASNRPGGFGGYDIYRAEKDSKGNWSNVKNLGPTINTEFHEDGPFIDLDGTTLYFASTGHGGMGGFDIYKSMLQGTEFTEPLNLGYPINTPDDDMYMVVAKDGKRAYYSSVREDGMGYVDLYMINIPEGLKNVQPFVAKKTNPEPVKVEPVKTDPVNVEPVKTDPIKVDPVKKDPPKESQPPAKEPSRTLVPLKYRVTVVDGETNAEIDARVRMQGLKDNVVVASSRDNGVHEFSIINPKPKDYRLYVEQEGFVFVNESVRIEGASSQEKVITRVVSMRKLNVAVSGILRNIYFDFNKATFKDESYNELNKLERMMQQNSALQIEISGHTDNVGGKSYNKHLSQRRAEAVKDYLARKGIDARRIVAQGYGESKPLATNDDDQEGRELNRRVEFKVINN